MASNTLNVFPLLNSIFVGTFNMNNADLSPEDTATWLAGAKDADLVVLALQECGACRSDGAMPPPENKKQQGEWCRVPKDSGARNINLLSSVHNALSPDETSYSIVADVAMGEPATGKKVVIDHETKTEWYGYIRMIVLAKSELTSTLSSACKTFVCPVGSKVSADALSSHFPGYRPNLSPDKGAVCVALGEDLLLVNVHLYGTNKYNVPEDVFDKMRRQQLSRIGDEVLMDSVRFCVVAGDFNFRCEVHPTDKSRGGRDFQAVHDIVTSDNAEAVSSLYHNNDRLLQILHNKSDNDDEIPPLLKNTSDAYVHAFQSNKCILPTFTFARESSGESSSRGSRPYSDKRTPSWTDRVVFSNELQSDGFGVTSVDTYPSVTVSDHIPVHCRFDRGHSSN